MALLLDVSTLTVSNWETERTSPSGKNKLGFAELRKMGVREVWDRLERLGEALHRTWEPLGERIHRKLQREAQRRIAQRRDLYNCPGGQSVDRLGGRRHYNHVRPHSALGYRIARELKIGIEETATVQDSPRLALIVLDSETEWKDGDQVVERIADWTSGYTRSSPTYRRTFRELMSKRDSSFNLGAGLISLSLSAWRFGSRPTS